MPDSIPVYNVVTSYGAPGHTEEAGFVGGWLQTIRPKTPEELAVQSFLTIQGGAQGLEFDELSWNGRNLGIADRLIGVGRVNWSAPCETWPSRDSVSWDTCDCGEWDILPSNHPKDTTLGGAIDPKWILPQMWLGLRSRYLATRRIVEELRKIAPVYERLYYKQEQMSVHDERQSFDSMPMVTGLRMQRADTSRRDGIVAVTTSDSVDAREATYAELTHFYPGTRDSAGVAANARYVAVTNRRTFPIDHAYYGSRTDSLDAESSNRGFGFIDVRRPLITLKNSTPEIAESFLVEKVGHEDSLHWNATAGEELALDWLEPGWGGLYRITPIATGISKHGIAATNAAKSINIAGPQPFGPDGTSSMRRAIVYERDSAVYLRTETSPDIWSAERLVSAVAELRTSSGRSAANFSPAISAVVTPNAGDLASYPHLLVTWERRSSTGQRSVRARAYTLQTSTGQLDSTAELTVSPSYAPAQMSTSGIELAPAVVGVAARDSSLDDACFVVAWVSPTKQVLLRTVNAWSGALSATASPVRTAAHLALTSDSLCRFATLAFGRRRHADSAQSEAVHVAWQQGPLAGDNRIFYSQMPLRPLVSGIDSVTSARALGRGTSEHVSHFAGGCTFTHPCIAADSTRVGVAFEIKGERNAIGLRFRDPFLPAAQSELWRGPVYKWGGYDRMINRSQYGPDIREYQWPSLVQFPAVPSSGEAPGAIAWQWVTGDSIDRNRQLMYWFGGADSTALPNGQFAGLTTAPNVASASLAPNATSVVHRATESRASTVTLSWGTPLRLYPLFMLTNDHDHLRGRSGGVVRSGMHILVLNSGADYCLQARYMAGIRLAKSGIIDTSVYQPVPPPAFYRAPALDTLTTSLLERGSDVARTSVFEASSEAVVIERIIAGSDSLISGLDEPAFNPFGQPPADIGIITELVDDSSGAVLWHSDTVWARSVADSTRVDSVAIPVAEHATAGDPVFVRLRAILSPSLPFEVLPEFHIEGYPSSASEGDELLDEGSETELLRGVRPGESRGEVTLDGGLSLAVRPNPSNGSVSIELSGVAGGSVMLKVLDGMGRDVRAPMTITIGTSGSASIPIALEGSIPGVYTVTATVDGVTVASRFSIVR